VRARQGELKVVKAARLYQALYYRYTFTWGIAPAISFVHCMAIVNAIREKLLI